MTRPKDDSQDRLDVIVGDARRFDAIWASDDALATLVARALDRGPFPSEVEEALFSAIRSVRDVLVLIRDLDVEDAIALLDDFVLHRASSEAVIRAMVDSKRTYETLPRPGAWVGHALFVRGAHLLNEAPERRFELDELIPVGADADRASARALLSSAAESGQLTERALAEARRLYPNERSGALAQKP